MLSLAAIAHYHSSSFLCKSAVLRKVGCRSPQTPGIQTLVRTQNLWPVPDPLNRNLHFHRTPGGLICTFKFEKWRWLSAHIHEENRRAMLPVTYVYPLWTTSSIFCSFFFHATQLCLCTCCSLSWKHQPLHCPMSLPPGSPPWLFLWRLWASSPLQIEKPSVAVPLYPFLEPHLHWRHWRTLQLGAIKVKSFQFSCHNFQLKKVWFAGFSWKKWENVASLGFLSFMATASLCRLSVMVPISPCSCPVQALWELRFSTLVYSSKSLLPFLSPHNTVPAAIQVFSPLPFLSLVLPSPLTITPAQEPAMTPHCLPRHYLTLKKKELLLQYKYFLF